MGDRKWTDFSELPPPGGRYVEVANEETARSHPVKWSGENVIACGQWAGFTHWRLYQPPADLPVRRHRIEVRAQRSPTGAAHHVLSIMCNEETAEVLERALQRIVEEQADIDLCDRKGERAP